MERRVLLAIFLAFLVLYAWQALFVKPAPKPAPGGNAAQSSSPAPSSGAAQPESTPAAASATPAAAPANPAPSAAAPAEPEVATLVGDTSEHDIRIETQDVIAVFTNKGARLKSWQLKHYRNQRGEPQELVEQAVPMHPLPFTLRTGDVHVDAVLDSALFKQADGARSGGESAPVDLRFEYRDSAGVHATKVFHVAPSSYVMSVRATVTSAERALPVGFAWGPAVGDIGEVSRYTKKAEGLIFQGGKPVRLQAKDIAKQPVYDGDFKYAGVDDNYFMTTALYPGPSAVTFQPVSIPSGDPKEAARDLVSFTIQPQRGDELKFFIGPKDFDVLTAIDPDVAKGIDFGMFTIIVVPLLRSLKWVNAYVGNYGWSIIILTFIINVILFPLRHKSVVSMRKMQEIQPEVKAIQDRYKNLKATDPAKQKMNTELMALYKERGVNPASGCVPMLLTFPFIFAFYALLSTAIELRGAPWFGWIHDLSSHDPYFVTPILMGISQIWQQRLAPATGMDPVQQKMTMLMPVFFTFLFLWYPAGVALYWLVNNVWAIGQQYLTNYMIGPPKVARPAGASASERRMKRVGSGKTEGARDNQ